MTTNKRSRGWCWTLNNWTAQELDHIEKQALYCEYVYIIWGRERGDRMNTEHLQGYVEFKNPVTLVGAKRRLVDRAHLEMRRGTPEEAAEYCKKGGEWIEYGKPLSQGKRTDLDAVAAAIKEGATIREVMMLYPATAIRYHKGMQTLHDMCHEHRNKDEKCKVTWLWGDTGTGKTRTAVEAHDTYYIKDGTQWWDGYDQQEAIIIDDFDGRWPFRDLLRLLDRFPYQGQVKGGYVRINSPHIYITSDLPPERYWTGKDLGQMVRRIDEIRHLETEVSESTEVAGNTSPPLQIARPSADVNS